MWARRPCGRQLPWLVWRRAIPSPPAMATLLQSCGCAPTCKCWTGRHAKWCRCVRGGSVGGVGGKGRLRAVSHPSTTRPLPPSPVQAYLATLAVTKVSLPAKSTAGGGGGGASATKPAPVPTPAATIATMPPPADVGKAPVAVLHAMLHSTGPDLIARADAALARARAATATSVCAPPPSTPPAADLAPEPPGT